MQGSYLGPEYSQEQIEEQLNNLGAVFTSLSENELIQKTVTSLAKGQAVGWFQGRMEFGPRS